MELSKEQKENNLKILEEKLKNIQLSTHVITVDLKNYEKKDQKQLCKLVSKYETIITNINKKKYFNTRVRDYKIQKCIVNGYKDCKDEGFNLIDIKNKWIITIKKLLEPVIQLYENRKLESNKKQLLSAKEKAKEKLTCDICGSIYSRVNKSRHLISKTHLEAKKELIVEPVSEPVSQAVSEPVELIEKMEETESDTQSETQSDTEIENDLLKMLIQYEDEDDIDNEILDIINELLM